MLHTDDLRGGAATGASAGITYWSITPCWRAARSSDVRSAGSSCSEAWQG